MARVLTRTDVLPAELEHGCLLSLLGDGVKRTVLVYGEEKNILYQADQSSQGRTKITCTGKNEPTKDRPLSFLFFESPFSSVSTVSRAILHSLSCDQEGLIWTVMDRPYCLHCWPLPPTLERAAQLRTDGICPAPAIQNRKSYFQMYRINLHDRNHAWQARDGRFYSYLGTTEDCWGIQMKCSMHYCRE